MIAIIGILVYCVDEWPSGALGCITFDPLAFQAAST
jgi:hypothetical protein